MTDRSSDASLSREIGSLVDALEALQREVEPGNRERRRLPTPREVLRFTSEVTIPAAILVLETNVRVLKLLQRAIRATSGEPARQSPGPSADAVRERVETLGQQTLSQLDQTLEDLQSALQGRPADDDAVALLEEARRLQDDVQAELGDDPMDVDTGPTAHDAGTREQSGGVDVDIDAEIASIKDQLDDDGDDGSGAFDGEAGAGFGDETGRSGHGDDTGDAGKRDGADDDGANDVNDNADATGGNG